MAWFSRSGWRTAGRPRRVPKGWVALVWIVVGPPAEIKRVAVPGYNERMPRTSRQTARHTPIRVLFGCAGWPSGVLDVGSWAARRGLAEVAIVQIQPGLVMRLDRDEASLLVPGPIRGDLADVLASGMRSWKPGLEIVPGGHRRWELRDRGARRLHAIDVAADGAEVFDLSNMQSPACLDALRRLEQRRGGPQSLVSSEGELTEPAWQALAAVGGRFAVRLVDERPHVVGFRIEGGDCEQIAGFVRAVRLFSDAEVVLGGPTATSHPREVLDDLGADYVMAGEAEVTFARFLELARLRNSRDRAAEIPGMAYRYGERTFHNALPQDGYERTAADEDGDACARSRRCLRNLVRPVTGSEVLQENRLDWSLLSGFERPFDSLFFTGGRGCPGACTFCAKLHGQEVRTKTARQLLAEIEAAHARVEGGTLRVTRWPLFEHTDRPDLQELPVAWAAVYDEDFFLHRRRAIELLRLWDTSPLKHHYRLSFQTNPCTLLSPAGDVHPELLAWIDRLKPMVQLGAESFHPEVLARWRKRHTLGQLETVLGALEGTRQDYTVFILLTDFDTTAEELLESLRRLVLAALSHRGMRIASSPFTIPLYDSETRRILEYRRVLTPERVRHFSDYERPQPGWMDPLVAELADLADAELRFALNPQHRDSALVAAYEVVHQRIADECRRCEERGGSRGAGQAALERLAEQAGAAMTEIREARFPPIPWPGRCV